MKAVQFSRFGGPDVLKYVDVADPAPAKHQLLIDVSFAGVNFPDIREREGIYQRSETHVGGVNLPRISGLQVVGRVSAVGDHANSALLGKKVVSYLASGGGYAQKVVTEPDFCVEISESADERQLAALPCQGLTAYFMLTHCTQLKNGESLLVHGAAGGVGSIAIQIAKLLGAGLIIGTASSEEKQQFIKSLGANNALDYNANDWTEQVLTLTEGIGVDVLLESIGGDIFNKNFDCLSTFGRYIIFGSTNGPGEPFAPRSLMTRCQSIAGIYLPVFAKYPALISEGLSFLVEHTKNGSIRAHVANVLPLSEASKAHVMLQEKKVSGILVLDVLK